MKKLTDQDFCEAADILGCEIAAIKSVARVESGGRGGFDSKGRVLLRFEGHKFRKFTRRKFDRSHPHLSYSYGRRKGKPHGYSAFNAAFKLDKVAAMKACSIGMFQPMVFNYHDMGYASIHEMWDDFKQGEGNQLLAFVRLIQDWGLDDELRRAKLRDFITFARMYNVARFRDNDYHNKMHRGYLRFRKQKIDCSKFKSEPMSEEEAEDLIANLEETATVPAVDPPDEFEPEFSEPSEDSTLHTQENTETPSTDPVETEQSPSKSDEEEPSSGAEMEKFNAFIPQIDTFKKWAFRFFGGTVIGNAFVWYAEAPIELRVLLGVLVLLIVAGVMVVFAKYHDKVFEYVLGMNLKKSGDPEVKPLDSASLSIKR